MKYSLFILLVISCALTACGTQENQTNGTDTPVVTTSMDTPPTEAEMPTFHIYGELAPDGYLDEANPITEPYGFKLKRIAGCEVEENTVPDAKAHNQAAFDKMSKQYGEDWREQFEAETNLKLFFSLPY